MYNICLVDNDVSYLKSFKKYIESNFRDFIINVYKSFSDFKKDYKEKSKVYDVMLISDEFLSYLNEYKLNNVIVLKSTKMNYEIKVEYIEKYQSMEKVIIGIREILVKKNLKFKKIEKLNKYINNNFSFEKDLTDEEINKIIEKEINIKLKNFNINKNEKNEIKNNLFNSIRRLDIIQPLLDDENIDEIMINGYENIYIERNGKIIKTEYRFEDKEKLDNLISNIVGKVNREINEAFPIVDARLSNGSRVNIVLSPVALNGPIVTIRKFKKSVLDIKDLINNNTINNKIADFLKYVIGKRLNVIISGGTASGKTTLLNIVSNFIDKDERIITIEDSAELNIKNIENLIRLETRNSNSVNSKNITIRDLIKNALRMRPDRIIVGEVRGEESIDMLQVMNTGHNGSLSTAHANSCKDMLTRLETMVLLGNDIPLEAVRRQIFSAIDIIIHLSKLRSGERRVVEISEISSYENGNIILNKIYDYFKIPLPENNLELKGIKQRERSAYY
jgi:pilus assembly protein CpaF